MAAPQPTTEGTVPFSVPSAGKECFTAYKIFGSLTAKDATPLILVHGGPGITHDYMLAWVVPLYEERGIPLILYDQIGNGASTHLREKKGDEGFWRVELFNDELFNLVEKLGLTRFDLMGHSWGAMMGSTFAAKRPRGLRRLILSNGPASARAWVDAYQGYRREMPREVQEVLERNEAAGTVESAEYQAAVGGFLMAHMCTVPFPELLLKTLGWVAEDDTVSNTMSGSSQFAISGSFRDWSVAGKLKDVEAETLVINGVGEGTSDEGIKPFLDEIKNVKWVKFENSTHVPFYEEPEKYFKVVGEFLLRE